MAYQTVIPDMFELSGPPRRDLMMTYAGGDPAYPVTFGPIIEPMTFETAHREFIGQGDKISLDGSTWTVTGLNEALVNKYARDPNIATEHATSAITTLSLSDGVSMRYFAVELDSYVGPVRDSSGQILETTYIQIWNLDSTWYLNGVYFKNDDPNTLRVVCFATGSMIETTAGPRRVETLRTGDRVRTRDNGFQPLRWIGGRELSAADLATAPNLLPVHIAAGALGPGCPAHDLTVSPQHRMLLRSPIAARVASSAEVLVAAVQLVGMPGITRGEGAPVGYWHMMFDAHEIVFANGAESESLYLGRMAKQSLTPAARAELRALFPDLMRAADDPRPPARPILRGAPVRKLLERQVKNRKPLVAAL